MAAWRRWLQLGEKLRGSCGSNGGCLQGAAAVVAAGSIDAARAATDTPIAGVSGRSGARQFNPVREAALRPGGCGEDNGAGSMLHQHRWYNTTTG